MNFFITIVDYCYAVALKIASTFIKLNNIQSESNSKTIIVIHGMYESPLFFRQITQALASKYNVLYSYSIYGAGGGVGKNARLIADYIKKNHLQNVILLGHSSGGLTAVQTLKYNNQVTKVIAIAAPFHGVYNGHLIRTKIVKELLPTSELIQQFNKISSSHLNKIVSIYPSFDNQVWSKKGSYLEGVKNIQINSKGHHLVLRSRALKRAILSEL